jgi:hypothetical protein
MAARLEAKTEATHKKLMAAMGDNHERMMSCLEKMEACLECKEPSEEMKSAVEHREVPKEHAAVKPVGLRNLHRSRNLAAQRRQEPKEWTRGNWIPEEIGCCPQKDEPPCRSGMARRTHAQGESD